MRGLFEMGRKDWWMKGTAGKLQTGLFPLHENSSISCKAHNRIISTANS